MSLFGPDKIEHIFRTPLIIKLVGDQTTTNLLAKIMALLTDLEREVQENNDAVASAIVLLKGLKDALDAAGTDAVKLKALSDSLSDQTDSLAAAVVANTPTPP